MHSSSGVSSTGINKQSISQISETMPKISSDAKGQLISKCPYEMVVSFKIISGFLP